MSQESTNDGFLSLEDVFLSSSFGQKGPEQADAPPGPALVAGRSPAGALVPMGVSEVAGAARWTRRWDSAAMAVMSGAAAALVIALGLSGGTGHPSSDVRSAARPTSPSTGAGTGQLRPSPVDQGARPAVGPSPGGPTASLSGTTGASAGSPDADLTAATLPGVSPATGGSDSNTGGNNPSASAIPVPSSVPVPSTSPAPPVTSTAPAPSAPAPAPATDALAPVVSVVDQVVATAGNTVSGLATAVTSTLSTDVPSVAAVPVVGGPLAP